MDCGLEGGGERMVVKKKKKKMPLVEPALFMTQSFPWVKGKREKGKKEKAGKGKG